MRTQPLRLLLSVTLAVSIQVGTAQALQEGLEPPELDSHGQLIEVLMTAEQQASWAALRSDSQRQEFLREFWSRLDPTPGTQSNELQTIFLRRAARAAELFGEGEIPGYATDRGRVLMVYGLPDTQELRALPPGTDEPELVWTYKEVTIAAGIRFVGGGGAFELVTELPLGAQPFRRSAESELRLLLATGVGRSQRALAYPKPGAPSTVTATTTPPPTTTPSTTTTPPPATTTTPSAGAGATGAGTAPPTGLTDRVTAPSVGVAGASVAPEVRVWMRMVFGGVMRDEIGLRHRIDFFPAVEGTYTVLSFQIETEDLDFLLPPAPAAPTTGPGTTPPAAGTAATPTTLAGTTPPAAGTPGSATTSGQSATSFVPTAQLTAFGAVLQGPAGQEDTIHQFIVPFAVPDPAVVVPDDAPPRDPDGGPDGGETPLRSVGVTLLPGTYRLAWGIYEAATDQAVTRDLSFTVPDFGAPGLLLSSTIIARPPHGSYSKPMSTDKVYEGLRLGNVQIVDDLDREVGRNQTIEVVTIVTGWQSNPAQPGKPRLEVEYRLLDGETSIVRLPAQELDFQVLGQQIPLAQVDQVQPGGTYVIEMRVKDLISGEETIGLTPIRIRAASASPESR